MCSGNMNAPKAKYIYPIFILAILLVSIGIYAVAVNAQRTIAKVNPILLERMSGKAESRLRTDGDSVYVFVRLQSGYGLSEIKDLMINTFAYGPRDSPTLIYGKIEASSILELASRVGVSFVAPDSRIEYDRIKADPQAYREGIAVDMFRVREILGANRVNDLGISGDGVTIAITDTGTDFATADLESAIARDDSGMSVSFDPDGQSFVITELAVERDGGVLKTKGMTVDVWNPASYTYTDEPTSSVEQVSIDVDYGAPTVESLSGRYHFGILRQTIEDDISGETVTIDFPVVVVDATQAGVYNSVVVDMSTGLYNFLKKYGSKLNSEASDLLNLGLKWPEAKSVWNDHSFADEAVHTSSPGNDVFSLDITKDGVADFSAGMLAYGIDLGGREGQYFALLPPVDPSGNFINVFFDYQSHGTSTASNAAARGNLMRDIYKNKTEIALPGIAPKTKVMGIKALWLGDVTFGWYYAAGFDWDPVTFAFRYTGKHRADIISNSWGVSDAIWGYGSTFGVDALSQLANALALPGYLDPAYPGIVILVSAGNGGFGYGTVTTPSSATLAISVGASTSYGYRTHPSYKLGGEAEGKFDEVVPWSARGPTTLGEPKPDVVNIGAFGFTDQSSFTGYGDGKRAYTVFGGTSMSCPVTAGVVALVIEEYRKTHNGNTPPADVVKSILASTAKDLSYDVFTQGSGRVDAFEAVAAAAEGKDSNFPTRFYASSTTAWETAKQFVAGSWVQSFKNRIPDTQMTATKWFAGIVKPGDSVTTSLTIHNAAGGVQAEALVFKQIDNKTYSGKSPGASTSYEGWIVIPKEDIPEGTDLMKVTLVYHFTDFADTKKWDYKDVFFVQLYDVDSKGALRRVTNAAPFSAVSELVVSQPSEKFSGTAKVRILNYIGPSGVPFKLVVKFYQRVSWDWISDLNVSAEKVDARLSIPAEAAPGVYDGLIILTDGSARTVVPVSVLVPIVAAGEYGGSNVNTPYSNYAVYGAFDWSWRYESGDWRVFAIMVPKGTPKLTVGVSWSETRTDIQAHLTAPSGYLLASSEYPESQYQGSGVFKWKTSTGKQSDEIVATIVEPGVYLVVLHNTLIGVSSFSNYPESYTLTVQF